MRFDEQTRNILILKLRYTPASVLKLERHQNLVTKVIGFVEQLQQSTVTKDTKVFATEQLQKIRQWIDHPLQSYQQILKKERQAYYSFCR